MQQAADDLVAWIAHLRGRLARGDLDGLGSFETGAGRLPLALAARIIVADLDHFGDLDPETRREPAIVARHRSVLDELQRLRERIG